MLIFAASRGRDDLVARLLAYQDVDVNERNRRGRTPLFAAASKGHARVVELLLEREDVQVLKQLNRGSAKTPFARRNW